MQHDGRAPQEAVEAVIPVQLFAEAADTWSRAETSLKSVRVSTAPITRPVSSLRRAAFLRKGQVVPSFLVSTQRKWWTPPSRKSWHWRPEW